MSLQPISTKPFSGRRILVVEDEYFLAEDIACALRDLGARVVGPVGEFKEAASLVDADLAIDAAVIDINLRNDMVFPLVRILQARKVPFLFTTGYDRKSIEEEFQDIKLFEKPLDLAAMVRDLAVLIESN